MKIILNSGIWIQGQLVSESKDNINFKNALVTYVNGDIKSHKLFSVPKCFIYKTIEG